MTGVSLIEIIGYGVVGVVLLALLTHVYASVIAAPWVPTRRKDYARIVQALGPLTHETIADLGAGGGGVMRAIARAYPGVRVVGYEISLLAWIIAQWLNGFWGLRKRCEIRMKNFYEEDLSRFDAVYCFLTPSAMRKLKPKFERELKPGTRVVSYAFSIPGWEGEKRKESPAHTPLFVYQR
ncbi:hypothetical protein A3J43_03490 [Candidatus Uhrbacteria bacterium RIFCSPHIGHO2_12_FULL_54_23]|uniref:Uncharacterized protein n=3 Tax=Candidatus Uhriibacteriota TaxID=1752732 RepID=A0A1F7UNB0_9BACT|nr:MAG: hypothetical protein A3J43_03490 [Candidatus Uhrbacteria bacterium RIFCSPHIGHO2_12_FULL_54_23]OGL85140.1 MAG: hypothetical protein A3B36_02210 [Candidatus Uhrbacteria bacterium RIFCSPLOWO2_01_FULL_55_36]OGL91228.1 MAG: hypothetical protein A3J36_02200 [Candidatus Uhrbacteria bacterium RIFCSPLOWO2_02_FULL_54_37]